MSRRWTLHVTTNAGSTLVRGWRAGTGLMEGGWKPIWLGGRRSWAVDARHEADVLAYLQSRRISVIWSSSAGDPGSDDEISTGDVGHESDGDSDVRGDHLLTLLEDGGAA